MNKKGNWPDIFEFGIGSLVMGIAIIITFILISGFNTSFISAASNNTLLNDSDALSSSQDIVNKFPAPADSILPIIYIFFLGFSAWSARKIPSSHMFAFIGVILLVIVFLFSMFIETGWQEFSTHVSVVSSLSNFPITNFMISYLRYFTLFYGLIVGWALYAKTD